MNDREGWRERVRDIRADSTTRWWWWWLCIFSYQHLLVVFSWSLSDSKTPRVSRTLLSILAHLFAYGLPKETVAAIMILYRNTKVKVCSPDGDVDFFDILAGLLQRETLTPYTRPSEIPSMPRCCGLNGLDSSSDFQYLQCPFSRLSGPILVYQPWLLSSSLLCATLFFFCSLARSKYLSLCFLLFFTQWSAGTEKFTRWQNLFFLIITRSDLLAGIRWSFYWEFNASPPPV